METTIPGLVASLFRQHGLLLARFAATSGGGAVATMGVIYLIREFLAGAIHEPTFLTGLIASAWGPAFVPWVVAALLLGAYIVGSYLTFDNEVVVQRIVKAIEVDLMERVVTHLMALAVPYADRQSHGDIIQTVRSDITQLRTTVHSVADMLMQGTIAVGIMATATALSPTLGLWALLVVPLATIPFVFLAKRIRMRSYEVRRTGYMLFDIILEILRGMRVIKTFRGEKLQTQASIDRGRAYFDDMIEIIRLQSLARMLLESLAGFSLVVVILVGGFQVMRGELSWPSFLAFVMAVRSLHKPLNAIYSNYISIQAKHASLARIADFLNTEPELRDAPDAAPLDAAPQVIRCEHVGFSYGDEVVLDDVSFTVHAGETIGIVGPSGAGKSTLLNLLIRLYDVRSGHVYFDDRPITSLRLADVYDKVAIVAQEPFLFAASVRENILCGRRDATEAEIEAAARAACIHDEILALPQGYDTAVGIGGRGVSRGQAQRINLARAFLKNAPLLLLDEATSSLDSVAEARVQEAIDRLLENRTSFVVAHRLSTLRNADRLLVLCEGRRVGFGTHEQLLRDCAVYREIWRTQQLSDDRVRIDSAEARAIEQA